MDLGSQFAVNETGAATIMRPIQVPPGTGGMEPRLALSYNSQTGNGLLGIGWSLSGLSAITRCPRTIAQDGVRGSVNFNVDDRFCLDGQRLMSIGGTYGAAGTEYRTERDSFSKIVSNGTAGGGPAWFKVWTKAGQVLEYGNTANSFIETQGRTSARTWAVNKIIDTQGNYIAYTYIKDSPNGDYYPSRIDYTGNSVTGLVPNASVQFIYETRPDIVPLYFLGSFIKSTQRLKVIRTYKDAIVVKEHRLTYGSSPISSQSRLNQLAECAGSGTQCLAPLTLTWGGQGLSAYGKTIAAVSTGDWDAARVWPGDYNGDGKTDLLSYFNSTFITFFANGDGTYSKTVVPVAGTGWDATKTWQGDYNGDGKTDLLSYSGSTFTTFLSNGDGTYNKVTSSASSSDWDSTRVWSGDFNGDGRTDLLSYFNSTFVTFFANGDGTYTKRSVPVDGTGWDVEKTWLGDYNGDGRMDLLSFSGSTFTAFLSNGDGTYNAVTTPVSTNDWDVTRVWPGDYNGDGKTDLLSYFNSTFVTFVAKGDGTFTKTVTPTDGAGWDAATTWSGDFNGDGRTDLLSYSGITFTTFLSNGDGTYSKVTSPVSSNDWNAAWVKSGDHNGDGRTDLLSYFNSTFVTFVPNTIAPDAVISVTNGLGASSTVVYKPLTSGTVYSKGSGATYPIQDIQAPLYVVSQGQSSNGIGGTLTTNYIYGGLKADISGRGLLGFGWQQATSLDTGLSIRTDYLQDWPYAGLTAQIKKTHLVAAGPGNQLSLVANTYACLNDSGAACTIAVGNRYAPYLSQSVESAWDLGGAALPIVSTMNQFDQFGNATQITVSADDGYSKTTTNTYSNDITRWLLGRLTHSTVQSNAPDINTGSGVAPTLTVFRTPLPLVAGQSFTANWVTTNATSVSYNCTASGTGYVGSATLPTVNGSTSGTALTAWVGYPSSCIWTATGPGGSTTYTETLTTVAVGPVPSISVSRMPSPAVAGQSYTTNWTTTNASSVSYNCTASWTGYSGSATMPTVNGSATGTALLSWVGFPSSCTWTATGPGGSTTYTETLTTVAAPTISVSRTPSPVVAGQSYTTNWTATYATSVSYSCTASGTGYVGSATLPTVNGSASGTALAAWVGYPSSCTWTVTGPGGSATYTETLTTVAAPTISVSRTPIPLVAGQSFTANWVTTNATSVSYNCTASGTGYVGSATLPTVNGSTSGTALAAWVGYPSTCVYTATGPGGSTTYTEILTTVVAAAPSISVSRMPSPLVAGQSYTTNWTTTNASSISYNCTASWTGYSGSATMPTVNGSATGTALLSWVGFPSSCTWTATGPGGSTTYTETLTTVAAPTISFSRTPSPMTAGQSFTANWATTNATSVSYNCTANGTGYVGSATLPTVNGSTSGTALAAWVGYPSTCVYTATGPGGSTTYTETLTTLAAAPTISFSRTPSPMTAGQSFTANWATTDATSVSYNCTANGTGFVGSATLPTVNGSTSGTALAAWVGYPSTCVYTAIGQGGSATYTEILTTQN